MAVVPTTTPPGYEWTFRRVVGATLVFSLVAFCFWLIFRFYQVVFILFIAVVIGTVLRPLANWLSQRGISRMASVILVYLAILLLIAGFLWLLFPVIFKQGATILGEVPAYYQGLRAWLVNSPSELFHRLGAYLPIQPAQALQYSRGRSEPHELRRDGLRLCGPGSPGDLHHHRDPGTDPLLDAGWSPHHPVAFAADPPGPA